MIRTPFTTSRHLCGAAALAALSACAPEPVAPDLRGPALEGLYADTARAIENAGGLRTDATPSDAPLSLSLLTRNFADIAFVSEFSQTGRRPEQTAAAIPLTRWEGPVRVGVIFGESVAEDQRADDMAEVQDLLRRYRRLTGLDIRYVPDGEINFLVLVLARDEQRAMAQRIRAQEDLPVQVAVDLENSPPALLCSASVFGPDRRNGGIAVAVALIKAEHRGILRRSCFHEEMTQALGLLNDSPTVRPSIFNDDEEFALLTTHDEILLRMLYDRRLRAGITLQQARPLLPAIARDAARASGARLVTDPASGS
ncbi:DUF2927 domain-containing protein [Halovulum dunhuangense]|uniref:DUF2927 domain-containing protein n=1 Tax=Halovulum dunhuangense TaxID=1505036 RepID=A0A849L147_9RHOB|nr:DUF2927 domain-containing protein [Halovulum dunhuangense]NNU79984.1 DUF2927 domain-containing protein [Halovulum dunhuangense]